MKWITSFLLISWNHNRLINLNHVDYHCSYPSAINTYKLFASAGLFVYLWNTTWQNHAISVTSKNIIIGRTVMCIVALVASIRGWYFIRFVTTFYHQVFWLICYRLLFIINFNSVGLKSEKFTWKCWIITSTNQNHGVSLNPGP